MSTPPTTDTRRPIHSIEEGFQPKNPQSPNAYNTEQRFAIANAGPETPVETAILIHRTPVPASNPEQIPFKIQAAGKCAYPLPNIAKTIPMIPPVTPSTIKKTAEAEIPSIS